MSTASSKTSDYLCCHLFKTVFFLCFTLSAWSSLCASQNSRGVVISPPFAAMEFKVWVLAIFLLVGSGLADEPKSAASPSLSSSPSPLPSATPAIRAAELESPLPEGTPQEQPPTVLLPEPNFLPPHRLRPLEMRRLLPWRRRSPDARHRMSHILERLRTLPWVAPAPAIY